MVDGPGAGFGGRSLCLSKQRAAGAAVRNGRHREAGRRGGRRRPGLPRRRRRQHYGFYPTGGGLRLTPLRRARRLLLEDPAIRPRPSTIGPASGTRSRSASRRTRLLCYVNDQLVVESTDAELSTGRVGLAKFRDTGPSSRAFASASRCRRRRRCPPRPETRLAKLVAEPPPSRTWPTSWRRRATPACECCATGPACWKSRPASFASWPRTSIASACIAELVKSIEGKEDDIDLFHAALLIARLDNDELDVEAYRQEVERMAQEDRRRRWPRTPTTRPSWRR